MVNLYLKLSKGSWSAALPMAQEDGPLLGPFRKVGSTADGLQVELIPSGGAQSVKGNLIIWADMVYYDKLYYEQWTVITEDWLHEYKNRVEAFDPEKAFHSSRKASRGHQVAEE